MLLLRVLSVMSVESAYEAVDFCQSPPAVIHNNLLPSY